MVSKYKLHRCDCFFDDKHNILWNLIISKPLKIFKTEENLFIFFRWLPHVTNWPFSSWSVSSEQFEQSSFLCTEKPYYSLIAENFPRVIKTIFFFAKGRIGLTWIHSIIQDMSLFLKSPNLTPHSFAK